MTPAGDIREIEADDIMEAMPNMRQANTSELNQLDQLLTRGQERGFRVTFPGTHRQTI